MKQSSHGSRLMVLSVDAVHPSFYRHPSESGPKIPNMLELAQCGARAEAVESVFPTTTYPAHATIVTGVPPRVHGIYSHLASLDPTEKARPWHWFAAAIRVPTLWTLARAHGLKTAAVSWPVSAGAPIDYNLPEIWDPAAPDPFQDLQTLARHATSRLFDELTRAVKPTAHAGPDYLRGEAARYVWKKYRPDLMLVHFVGYDQQAHLHGPRSRQALTALEHADHEIGRLREAAKEERVAVVVLSDHGFMPVEKEAAPLVILAEEGLFGTRSRRHPELMKLGAIHAGGSFAVFWLEEPSTAEQLALDRALKRIKETEAVAEVVGRDQLEALGSDPDAEWVLDAAPGYCFTDHFSGPVIRKTEADHGTHGHLPTHPEMEASFIATGPQIVPGKNLGRIKLTDMAPTLAHLLGVATDELATDEEPLKLD